MTRFSPVVLSALVVAAVVAMVGLRLGVDGIQPYGTDGAEYIEHTARLETAALWTEHATSGLWTRLVRTDGAFPAGLHLVTLPFAGVFGHSAEAASATGIGWFLLLLAAVGAVAATAAPIGSRLPSAALAAAATALVPAIHGGAGRYYYDLPMVALLWCVAAVLLSGRDHRPVLAGVVAGALGFAACLVKWAAAPYGLILVAACLFGRGDRRARPLARLLSVALAVAIPAWLVILYLGDVSGTSSFGHQAHITVPEAEGTEIERGAFAGLLRLVPGQWARLGAAELGFHPLRACVSVFSPLLFLSLIHI